MARSVAALTALVVLLMVGWQVLPASTDDKSDIPPEGLAAVDAEVTTTTSVPPTPEEIALGREVRRNVAGAIETLLAADSVQVTTQGAQVGYELSGTVEIDLTTGNYRSSQLESYDTGTLIRTEHVVVSDTLFVRFDQGDDNDGTKPFTAVDLPAGRQEFVDEALTMEGRAGASLERIVRYLDELPFDAVPLEPSQVDDRPATGYQVAFDTAVISRFLRDNDLELIGPADPDGTTYYEFWIDDVDGYLARIAVGGVQFQDGEALDGFGGELVYRPGGALAISSPL